jgi:Zn-dependent protease
VATRESYLHTPNIRLMTGGGGVTLFRIRGIRIAVDFSWFVVLFLIIIWLSSFYRDVLGSESDDTAAYLLAVASAVLFFASILLHELGHAFVARRHNIGVSGITLWMFGGFARLEKDSDTPGTEFKIAVAGPLVTAGIVAVCAVAGLLLAGGDEFTNALLTQNDTRTSGIAAMVIWLAGINLFVLGFNLIPAFPLDGGRIARAIAWRRTGSRNSGTRFAATLGEWFGLFLIAAGLGYFVAYQGDIFGGIWLAFIGFILRGAAKGALAQTEVTSRIEGISVADVMDRDPVAIPEGASIEQALDEYFLRYRSPWFPVVDAGRHFIGLVDRGAADNVPAVERASSVVSDVLARDSGSLTIMEDEPLESVLGNESLRRLGALIATDAEGHIRGVLTIDAIGRALRPVAPGSADTSL